MSTDVPEARAASIIALIMEAALTSETSVDIQLRKWQYIPEDSELYTSRRENLKSHLLRLLWTSDKAVERAFTRHTTPQHRDTKTNIHASSGIRTNGLDRAATQTGDETKVLESKVAAVTAVPCRRM
jgi:hypothetical protein